jgi:hypothetical protein
MTEHLEIEDKVEHRHAEKRDRAGGVDKGDAGGGRSRHVGEHRYLARQGKWRQNGYPVL